MGALPPRRSRHPSPTALCAPIIVIHPYGHPLWAPSPRVALSSSISSPLVTHRANHIVITATPSIRTGTPCGCPCRHPSVGAPLVGTPVQIILVIHPRRATPCGCPPPVQIIVIHLVRPPLVGALPPCKSASSSIRRGTPCGCPPPVRAFVHPSVGACGHP